MDGYKALSTNVQWICIEGTVLEDYGISWDTACPYLRELISKLHCLNWHITKNPWQSYRMQLRKLIHQMDIGLPNNNRSMSRRQQNWKRGSSNAILSWSSGWQKGHRGTLKEKWHLVTHIKYGQIQYRNHQGRNKGYLQITSHIVVCVYQRLLNSQSFPSFLPQFAANS